jgi:hypothetical protein
MQQQNVGPEDAVRCLEEVRLVIGANDGEPILEALLRYTFAAQLACAMKLEKYAKEHLADQPAAGFRHAARVIRQDIPDMLAGEASFEDAIARWKDEQTQKVKDDAVEVVRAWWEKAMGGLPGPALGLLEDKLQAIHPK